MYAVIKTGGKQYRVEKGDVIKVEKIALSRANQKTVKFDEVLMLNDGKKNHIGTPTLKDAQVEAKILNIGKLEKVVIYKYKAKKDYRRKQGHRQPYMELEITKVDMKAPKKATTTAKETDDKAVAETKKTTTKAKATTSTAKKTTTKAKATTGTAKKKTTTTAKTKTASTKKAAADKTTDK